MITPTNHILARGPWHFENFRNIFLPNIGEKTKKVLPAERGPLALCHMVNPTLVIALRSEKVR